MREDANHQAQRGGGKMAEEGEQAGRGEENIFSRVTLKERLSQQAHPDDREETTARCREEGHS